MEGRFGKDIRTTGLQLGLSCVCMSLEKGLWRIG